MVACRGWRALGKEERDTLKDYTHFLQALNFTEATTNRWQRRFDYAATGEYNITVDTKSESSTTPRRSTLGCLLTSNFYTRKLVVIDCVCRMLATGLRSPTLLLEKRYQLGPWRSGGKSDTTVLRRTTSQRSMSAQPLLNIE